MLIFNGSSSAQTCHPFTEGYWYGLLNFQGSELIVTFDIRKNTNDSLMGVMYSPLQSSEAIPITSIVCEGDSVFISVKSLGMKYSALINEKDSLLSGTFRQAIFKMPFDMKKTQELFTLKRPQEPQAPFNYAVENVSIENKAADVKLSGTLTLPHGDGPFPALVLVSGSGPQDRDEEIFGHKPFKVLADYLTTQGMAVLRYDDRGTGKSTGQFGSATSMDFAGDAAACLTFLRTETRIDTTKIGVIGHSEGGMIAGILGAQEHNLAFIVMLAGPALTGEDILLTQTRKMLNDGTNTDDFIRHIMKDTKKSFAILKKNPKPSEATAKLRKYFEKRSKSIPADLHMTYGYHKAAIEMKIQAMNSPWFRYFLSFNPDDYLKNVKCPMLALYGSKDVQVLPDENIQALVKIIKKHKKQNFTYYTFEGKNHLFQNAKTGYISEYALLEETFSPDVLRYLAGWINKQLSQ